MNVGTLVVEAKVWMAYKSRVEINGCWVER